MPKQRFLADLLTSKISILCHNFLASVVSAFVSAMM